MIMLILGLLTALTGAGFGIAFLVLHHPELRSLTRFYLVASGIFLALAGVLFVISWIRRGMRARRAKQRSGFALVMVLVLLAVMAGPVYQALTYAGLLASQADSRGAAARLRMAAADAVWAELAKLAGGGDMSSLGGSAETTPDGVEIRVTTQRLLTNEIPACLVGTNGVAAGTHYAVHSVAMRAGRTSQAEGYARRESQGALRVVGWIER